ncbi:uncharacterized protein PFL1_01827 [Pseudozyma flocculosa PF-1]|uniref:Uncharacterized protein n=1 Tax=Pseudozyma flocculosa TaxID=84751 RepID=A0A5C3EWQ2_9BASI|nr:uncharacterized protein PFL1_01827 [Pseudozyma flocculosa PF-1]EPQ30929.1 hypothetical protein PFL1_01827 [Pseudozyma flocculosa PF-1]SPO36683.1 uncharacterized protein PSFLO_02154 [Pseudozyma flocculosa]
MDFTLSGAQKAPPLRAAPSLDGFSPRRCRHAQPIPSATPGTSTDPPYLVHLASLSTPNPSLLAVSHPSLLTLVDKATHSVLHHASLADAHRITQLHALTPGGLGSTFIASSTAGTVSSFDVRSPSALTQPTLVLRGPRGAPYHSVAASPHATNPHLVAAGTELVGVDAHVDIYDVRSPAAPLFRYTESHSDDVTSLRFHPSPHHADILVTGSTDGLVCAIDTTVDNEDDAVIAVGNTASSVARSGWGGGGSQVWGKPAATAQADVDMTADVDDDDDLNQQEADARRKGLGSVWAVGDMQTLSVWDADKFDPLLDPVDVRSSTCLRPAWTTDYIIDAHCTSHLASSASSATGGVTLYVGTTEGSFSILTASPEGAGGWRMEALFPQAAAGAVGAAAGGHSDIVRCVDYDPASRILYSGGEDGRLCMWRLAGADDDGGDEADGAATQIRQSMGGAAMDQAPAAGTAAFLGAIRAGGGRGMSESSGGARGGARSESAHTGRSQRWKPYG